MKTINLQTVLLVGGLGLVCGETNAAITISIDMDTSTAGIQSTRTASVGDTFSANLVFDLGASFPTGLSAYGVTVRFDTVELSLNGASTESGPTGWLNLTVGVDHETETLAPPNSSLGELNNFEAYTLGLALTSGSFIAGTINFTVASVLSDGLADVIPGNYGGADGLGDKDYATIDFSTVTINPGYVVPEPQAYALCAGLGLLGWASYRRRRRVV